MNSRLDNGYVFNHDKKPSWGKPAFLVLLVVALYIWGSSALVPLSGFMAYPFLRLSGSIDTSLSQSLQSQTNLISENGQLKLDNEKLRVENLRLADLQTENEQLRGVKKENTALKHPVYAKVLVKPDHLPYDEIIIDLGKQEMPNLKAGALVFADDNVVLGQIDQVEEHYSRVQLYSTSGVSLPVAVGQVASPSVAMGMGSGNFYLLLPRGVSIRIGDPVKTSIIGSYLLGYVAQVYQDSNNPFQKILFRSPYNVFELNWVILSNG